jgi:hypothetical protein
MTDKNTLNDVVCPGYPGLFYEFASKDINAEPFQYRIFFIQ